MRVLLSLITACAPADLPSSKDTVCPETPGTICTWLGVPGQVGLSDDDLPRLEAELSFPYDGTFGPDGAFYGVDGHNHRILRVDPITERVSTVAGTGFLGDGPEGPPREHHFHLPTGITFDPRDDTHLVVAAAQNHRVVLVDLNQQVTSFLAGVGHRGSSGDGGPASEAALYLVPGVAFEPDGTLYVSDQVNNVIRRIDVAGTITTVVGQRIPRTYDHDADPGTPPVESGFNEVAYAGDGGPAAGARLHGIHRAMDIPSSRLTIHGRNLLIVDAGNHMIRKVDLDTWQIDRVAGRVETRTGDVDENPATPPATLTQGWPGFAGEGTPALDAVFNLPHDVAVDAEGRVYVADTYNHCVRRIDTDGIITTVAGQCASEPGFAGDGGPAIEARLHLPHGIELAPDGRLFIADTVNQVFRVVQP